MNTREIHDVLDKDIRLNYNSRAEFGRKIGMTRQNVKQFMDTLQMCKSGNSFNKIASILEKAGYIIEIKKII